MFLMARSLVDWLKPLFERFVAFGTQSTMAASTASFGAEVMRANREAAEAAAESIDTAEQLGASGVDAKRQVAELLTKGTLDTLKLMQQVTSGHLSVSEGREGLARNPFSESSNGSETISGPKPAAALSPSPTPNSNGTQAGAIPEPPQPGVNGTSPAPLPLEAPPRRPRGRPRKNPPASSGS